MQFIYFEMKTKINEYSNIIIEIFSQAINIDNYLINDYNMIIFFNYSTGGIKELVESLASDIYSKFLVYESINYKKKEELDEALKIFLKVKDNLAYNKVYLDNRILVSEISEVTEDVKKLVLSEYYKDKEMYKTIKIFLENNQNASNASKELFLHRNTLNQRLDKFQLITGFNVKNFIDAYLIYQIVK